MKVFSSFNKFLTALFLLTALFAAALPAQAWDPVNDALTTMAKFNMNFRLRYEKVDDASPTLENAEALTLRSRMSYESGAYQNFTVGLEMDDVTPLMAQEYNDGTNGNTAYSAITDPEGTEVNQVWMSYAGLPGTQVKFGRQRILLDNERFIGGVGFRQNEQTYDGLSIVNKSLPKTTLYYAKINNVNRIFGENNLAGADHKGDSDIFNVKYEGIPGMVLSAYGYLLDNETVLTSSSDTYGVRLVGKHSFGDPTLKYAMEYASQKDSNDNTIDYSADYSLIEVGFGIPKISATLGYEVMGADDDATVIATGAAATQGFLTPLATLHKFQGWADQFLGGGTGNIATGIVDQYVSIDGTVAGLILSANYHEYDADNETALLDELGHEYGASVEKKWGNYSVSAKYAKYFAEDFSFDKDKVWLTMQAAF